METKVMMIVKEAMNWDGMIDVNTDLFELGLDSMGVLKIIAYIEDAWDIEIEDEDITFDNMRTVGAIIMMLGKYDRGGCQQ